LAQETARAHGLRISAEDLNLLVEVTGASPSLLVMELEKLRLFAGPGGTVTSDDISKLVPQAQATTIFALVDALGRNDRKKALELLDILIREGEYLPLALSFLANQFRQALAAREAGLRGAGQIQGHFQKQGVPMWPSRAEQVLRTMNAFPAGALAQALRRIAALDLALRDIRPDDRVVVEEFVLTMAQ
jgi:DNA polymerase-3 subunit delta